MERTIKKHKNIINYLKTQHHIFCARKNAACSSLLVAKHKAGTLKEKYYDN